MKFKIDNDTLTCIEKEVTRAKSINWYSIDFEFSDEWGCLSKKVVFINENGTAIEEAILNNKAVIPNIENGIYNIGVVGLISQNNTISKRIGTNLLSILITSSGAEYNASTPSEESLRTYDYYLREITKKANEISEDLEEIEADKEAIAVDKLDIKEMKEATQGYSELAQEYVTAVTFTTFEVDLTTGKLYALNDEKLGNATFEINNITGKLEVGFNG